MLTSLTDEQIAQFQTYVDKWVDIGISTSPINVEASLDALKRAYENVGLEFPSKYEVYDSPFALIDAMKEKYGITVDTHNFLFGAHEATWLSYYNYFQEVCGIKECDQLTPFMDLAQHCGWVLAFDEMVALSSKPIHVKFDDEKRTHCENDLAIKYADGTGVAMWHGVRIPDQWVLDRSTITPEVCLRWENIEQRRCACEIIGWAKVLEQLHAVTIDQDPDPTVGHLVEVELPDVGTERFLLALDPNTNKTVGIPVPREMTTALEANSWTYGIEKFEFTPSFRV